MEHALMSTCTW